MKKIISVFLSIIIILNLFSYTVGAEEKEKTYVSFISYADSLTRDIDWDIAKEKVEQNCGVPLQYLTEKEYQLSGNKESYTYESIVDELKGEGVLENCEDPSRLVLIIDDNTEEGSFSAESLENVLPENWNTAVDIYNYAYFGLSGVKEEEDKNQETGSTVEQEMPEESSQIVENTIPEQEMRDGEAQKRMGKRTVEWLSQVSVSSSKVYLGTDSQIGLYYDVVRNSTGTIGVYNEVGEKVKSLYEDVSHSSLYYYLSWDLTDSKGKSVSSGTYTFRLEFKDGSSQIQKEISFQVLDGQEVLSNVSVGNKEVDISQEQVRIYYNVAHDIQGNIAIYDKRGNKIRQIYKNIPHVAGYYLALWDGRDDSGKQINQGEYTIKLQFGKDESEVKVKVIDGESLYIDLLKVSPDKVALGQTAGIYYRVNKVCQGTIGVYNEEGKEVRRLYDEVSHAANYYYLGWDMKDNEGRYVSEGNYTWKLKFKSGDDEIQEKLTTQVIDGLELTNVKLGNVTVTVGENVNIYYNVNLPAEGDIIIYDENNDEVYELYKKMAHTAGYYLAIWNGRDNQGNLVEAGDYTVKVRFRNQEENLKLKIKKEKILSDVKVGTSKVDLGNRENVKLYYRVNKASEGTIKVYNEKGNEVKAIYESVWHGAMYYLAEWDGTDNNGNWVETGTYKICLEFGADQEEVMVTISNSLELYDVRTDKAEVNINAGESAKIYYGVNKNVRGDIFVYGLDGGKIKTLYNNVPHTAGYYLITWDGTDENGVKVDSGEYLVKLNFRGKIQEVKIRIKNDLELKNVRMGEEKVNVEKRETAKLYYSVSKTCEGTIGVYDTSGALVNELYKNISHATGNYYLGWDLRDSSGNYVKEGTYEMRLRFIEGNIVREEKVSFYVIDNFELENVRVDEESFNLSVGTTAKIYYTITSDSVGSIAIYKKTGEKVADIYDRVNHVSGGYLATWDMKDSAGNQVPLGEYIVCLKFEKEGYTVEEEEVEAKIVDELALINVRTSSESVTLNDGQVYVYYTVTKDCVGDIEIYNSAGTKVYTLYDKVEHKAGYYSAFWQFDDSVGKKVKPGEYTFKLRFRDGDVVKTADSSFNVKKAAKKIWIDAGHGGQDVGAVNGSRYERDDNLKIALELQRVLIQQGQEVYMSRVDNDPGYSAVGLISLRQRVANANAKQTDVFVSLHRDSASASARGFTVYTHNANNSANYNPNAYANKNSGCVLLSTEIHDSLSSLGRFRSRGIKYGSAGGTEDLLVNRVSNMPSCLIEMGFISNSSDNIIFDTYLKQNAKAIAKGIMNYLGVPFDESKYTL